MNKGYSIRAPCLAYNSFIPCTTRRAYLRRHDIMAAFSHSKNNMIGRNVMAFFNSAIDVLQTLVVALGAGLGIWGGVNLLEGYGNDNPGANAHG